VALDLGLQACKLAAGHVGKVPHDAVHLLWEDRQQVAVQEVYTTTNPVPSHVHLGHLKCLEAGVQSVDDSLPQLDGQGNGHTARAGPHIGEDQTAGAGLGPGKSAFDETLSLGSRYQHTVIDQKIATIELAMAQDVS
jgi:hypothetical protein